MSDLRRLSINQATTRSWSIPDLVDAAATAGLGGVGLWREPVQELGVEKTAALVEDAGLVVTSLCRAGFFTMAEGAARRSALAENRAAIDEAAALGAQVLVVVAGGLPDGQSDLVAARERVVEAIGELEPHAAAAGVKLAIEPLHPMFCSDRCVVSTLDQALDIADNFDADVVGVVVDAYHVWWDPNVLGAIACAGDRIMSWQVCDWVTPLPAGVLMGRGVMGEGCIDLRLLDDAVTAAGYCGLVEVEIFNDGLDALPGADVLERVLAGYRSCLA
jgi:sugar phosphate isomerase/epimerase